MFEKLLALLINAKASAVSGVLIIGASGALVSATTTNGVTTVTVTQASPSPSAIVSPSPSPSPSPRPSRSPSPSPSASPAPSPSVNVVARAGMPATAECVEAVRRVNDAFKKHHTDLAKLHGASEKRGNGAKAAKELNASRDATAPKDLIKKTDDALKLIRKAAVKALHAAGCKHDDHDEHADDDDDTNHPQLTIVGLEPKLIADRAIEAMDKAMETLKKALETARPAPKPDPVKKPKPAKQPSVSRSASKSASTSLD